MSDSLGVFVAEDSALLRGGLVKLLESGGFDVVGEAANAQDLLSGVAERLPDVVITDIKMPPSFVDEGLRAAEEIVDRYPSVGVLVLSQYVEPRYALTLMTHGTAVGYLLKDRIAHIDEFLDSVRRVAKGESVVDRDVVDQVLSRHRAETRLTRLSPREKEILAYMAEGRSNSAICARSFVSPKTVEKHVASIFSKLDLPPAPDDHRRVLAVLAYLNS
jgi:DNA-binding NarL/FixJ family response regulator